MRSTNNRGHQKRNGRLKLIGLILLFVFVLSGATFYAISLAQENNEEADQTEQPAGDDNQQADETEPDPSELDGTDQTDAEDDDEEEPEEEQFTDIRVSAVGDVMGHTSQLEAAYNAETGEYDFTSVFEDVQPIISESDLAIANLETTLAGSDRPFIGYPLFNTPDAIIDALDYAGFDTIITTNNHSLDTGLEGVRRTVEVIEEKGLDLAGTFTEEPDSRVLYKDVEGIKIAILAYTEHLNGLDASYPQDDVLSMINVISEERILADIEEAESEDVDLMIAYMHWGGEYERYPNDFQQNYAELLTREGVDIILGSHPHVIQQATYLEVDGNESIVAYSLGNFVSNQRRETLGEEREPTEDGVIFHADVQKNEQTGETTVQHVEYTPTWVYRNRYEGDSTYTYRILPVERILETDEFTDADRQRMQRSLDETTIRLELTD
ncbi:CapA family protein [Alkalibacterium thalassium]|uniref:Poly-gamma-glutamate synthesis protein (Capsule biosynthesis protein) n=1 Tax=Alkalibacterium thalassium TaxID=426701 RepID=A0A1G9A4J9_9LACT|nr:CapA family protein [Alkalibacterium thalassium]SDK22272.1 poly-gamma-glutamate synthesis protein (capsule biosynthesis protein) [Alkalibacterium thalassium]